MNPWMTTVQEALAREGILSAPDRARLVPYQSYAENLSELAGQLGSFLDSAGYGGRGLTVFVDGTPKRCSEKGGFDMDGAFREALVSAGFSVDWIVLSELFNISPKDLHASLHTVEETRSVVRRRVAGPCLVLGSGSITDVVKHALFLEGITLPFVSIPTALTVTAFTSAFSVIDVHGAKRTQLSREISATFWLRSVLECAPTRMSRAGYGDLLARFLAYGDWYLGKELGMMDRYDECAFRLMEPFASGIKESAGGFACYPLPAETLGCATAALAMAGIAMSVSGETTPLSGFEHVISHGLDFLRLTSGREMVFHGEQVALGCLTSARTMDRLLEKETIDTEGWIEDPGAEGLKQINQLIDEAPFFGDAHPSLAHRKAQGPLAERIEGARLEFIGEYEKKSRRWREGMGRKDGFAEDWPRIRHNLARLTLRLSEIEPLMRQAGLPCLPEETAPPTSRGEYAWAVRFAPFVRSRMNVSDLIFWMGEDAKNLLDMLSCSV